MAKWMCAVAAALTMGWNTAAQAGSYCGGAGYGCAAPAYNCGVSCQTIACTVYDKYYVNECYTVMQPQQQWQCVTVPTTTFQWVCESKYVDSSYECYEYKPRQVRQPYKYCVTVPKVRNVAQTVCYTDYVDKPGTVTVPVTKSYVKPISCCYQVPCTTMVAASSCCGPCVPVCCTTWQTVCYTKYITCCYTDYVQQPTTYKVPVVKTKQVQVPYHYYDSELRNGVHTFTVYDCVKVVKPTKILKTEWKKVSVPGVSYQWKPVTVNVPVTMSRPVCKVVPRTIYKTVCTTTPTVVCNTGYAYAGGCGHPGGGCGCY